MGARGPKLTKQQRGKVEALVEQVMRSSGWSQSAAIVLAEQKIPEMLGLKLTASHLYYVKKKIEKSWIAQHEKRPLEVVRSEILEKLHEGQRLAIQSGNLGALNRLLLTEARITGVDNPEVIEHRVTGHDGGPVRLEVQGIVAQFAAQMPSLRPEQLAALAGVEVPRGGEIIEHGDNGSNGGGRPVLLGPAEPDGDPGDDGGNGSGGPPTAAGGGSEGDGEA